MSPPENSFSLAGQHIHTHTLFIVLTLLSSSCFSTHSLCCHSGHEAVGEIRMTKSLFIKLAECLQCFFFLFESLHVCLREQEQERYSKKVKRVRKSQIDGGWGPNPRAGGLSRIHSGLILGYCSLKPGINSRGQSRIKAKSVLSYICNSVHLMLKLRIFRLNSNYIASHYVQIASCNCHKCVAVIKRLLTTKQMVGSFIPV